MKDQSQKAGDESVQVQVAGGLTVHHHGPSFDEMRTLARDVFRENALELKGIAQATAFQRADELMDRFINELKSRAPSAIESFQDPDFQYALANAQIAYSRSGSQKLEDVLVESLVERATRSERDLLQIVLTESISTAAKLTDRQIDLLSLIFLIRYVRHNGVQTIEHLRTWLYSAIIPFSTSLPPSGATFQHLEYSGCGSVQITSLDLGVVVRQTYGICFPIGFDDAAKAAYISNHQLPEEAFIRCQTDRTLWQFSQQNAQEFREFLVARGVDDDNAAAAATAYDARVADGTSVKATLCSLVPEMKSIIAAWDESLNHFTLTSVGFAIAIASVRRKVPGIPFTFQTWID